MKNFIPVAVALAGALAISGCAYDTAAGLRDQQADASHALNQSRERIDAGTDETDAQLASSRDDWKVAVELGEKSYRESPTALSEFNLATAYQQIGRNDLARPLYANLIVRGKDVEYAPAQKSNASWPTRTDYNLAQESERRLDAMGTPNIGAGPTSDKFPTLKN